MQKNKILITGVAGFIASHIANRFLAEGYSVVGVDDLSGGKISNIPNGVDFIQGDLADPQTIQRLPTDCRQILHLAGQSSGEISFDDPRRRSHDEYDHNTAPHRVWNPQQRAAHRLRQLNVGLWIGA